MDYQIVHAIEGRLRLRIPLLESDAVFAGKLNQLVEAIASVTSVRINSRAQSIIITYRAKKIAQPALLEAIEAAIVQVTPPPEDPDEDPAQPAPDSSPPRADPQPDPTSPIAADQFVETVPLNAAAIDLPEDPWAESPASSPVNPTEVNLTEVNLTEVNLTEVNLTEAKTEVNLTEAAPSSAIDLPETNGHQNNGVVKTVKRDRRSQKSKKA